MKQIIAENKSFIRSVIKKITGNYNDDIEQEVYIKTWKNIDNYKEEGKFRQWIAVLTANVCRDYFRSRQYVQTKAEKTDGELLEMVSDNKNPEIISDAKKRQKIILQAVDNLPAKYRKIVIWFEFEELSYEQISNKTGLPIGTIKSRLYNARKILAEKLKFLKGEYK